MRRRIISMLIIALSLTIFPVHASKLSDKKDELEQAKDQIEDAKEELKGTQQAKDQIKNEIDTLDKQITTVEDKIVTIEEDLTNQKEKVAQAQQSLDEAIVRKEEQYKATKERMVEMYKNTKTGYVELIFSSNNLAELLNRSQYVKTISKYDNQLLDDYKAQEVVIQEKKAVLAEEQKQIEGLYAEQVKVKDNLASIRKDKNKKMGVLQSQENSLHAHIEEFEKISKELEAEIKKLTQNSTIKYNGGAFAWPVPGHYRLSSEYNPRENPISGKAEFHQGIDIPAPYGKSVVAAADGKVITAGWVRGFGNTVMIDHGSGIVSIYGHNSSVIVSTGQTVTKGQQVAKIGSTGYSTGNHCHFEVRINGRHTNPWNYLNK